MGDIYSYLNHTAGSGNTMKEAYHNLIGKIESKEGKKKTLKMIGESNDGHFMEIRGYKYDIKWKKIRHEGRYMCYVDYGH